MLEVQRVLGSDLSHAKELAKVEEDINRLRMEVHSLEHEARRGEAQLENIKADVEKKKLVADSMALSMDSHVVRNPKLCIATCIDALTDLMADCKGRLDFLNKGISQAELLYGHFGNPPMSVSDLVRTLDATKDSVKRFSAEMQMISEACDELSLTMYGTKLTGMTK
jgi:predicted RNase H-like nuclease (RuvC/YqgF family)